MRHNKSIRLGPGEWERHTENVQYENSQASLVGEEIFDLGIGDEALRNGLMAEETRQSVVNVLRDLYNTMANDPDARKISLALASDNVFILYCLKRGVHFEVGARIDFVRMGWEELCDVLDENSFATGVP